MIEVRAGMRTKRDSEAAAAQEAATSAAVGTAGDHDAAASVVAPATWVDQYIEDAVASFKRSLAEYDVKPVESLPMQAIHAHDGDRLLKVAREVETERECIASLSGHKAAFDTNANPTSGSRDAAVPRARPPLLLGALCSKEVMQAKMNEVRAGMRAKRDAEAAAEAAQEAGAAATRTTKAAAAGVAGDATATATAAGAGASANWVDQYIEDAVASFKCSLAEYDDKPVSAPAAQKGGVYSSTSVAFAATTEAIQVEDNAAATKPAIQAHDWADIVVREDVETTIRSVTGQDEITLTHASAAGPSCQMEQRPSGPSGARAAPGPRSTTNDRLPRPSHAKKKPNHRQR